MSFQCVYLVSHGGITRYFDYLFYIDFEASMADTRAQNALGHLQVLWMSCWPPSLTILLRTYLSSITCMVCCIV